MVERDKRTLTKTGRETDLSVGFGRATLPKALAAHPEAVDNSLSIIQSGGRPVTFFNSKPQAVVDVDKDRGVRRGPGGAAMGVTTFTTAPKTLTAIHENHALNGGDSPAILMVGNIVRVGTSGGETPDPTLIAAFRKARTAA